MKMLTIIASLKLELFVDSLGQTPGELVQRYLWELMPKATEQGLDQG